MRMAAAMPETPVPITAQFLLFSVIIILPWEAKLLVFGYFFSKMPAD
jgi:hypothetical protein